MVQGATYLIPVNIDVNLNYVDSIIFTLKCGETKVQKEYPYQTNILKNGKIGIPLNQYETTVLQGLVKIEAQINYKQGRVAKTDIDLFPISPTLATKFIDGSESTEPDIDPIQLNISDPVVAVGGATFIPSVSEDGVISWTNDGDLTNPKPVNIKGKDGKDGTPGANGATFVPSISSDGTLSWANDGGLQNPNPVNIKGKDGGAGAPGKNGVTFTPEVSNDGVLSWTNDGNLKNPESVDIKGKNGENGITYTPSVSNSGIISWENNGNLPNPEPVNIKGEQGTPGDTPYIGENGNWFIGDMDTGTPAGGSGGTGGTPNAVQYVPQTLTQEQQTQARKNIDAQSQVYAVKRANPWSAEDCVNASVRGLKLYGVCEQKQYSGKNLYDMSLQETKTKNGLTFSYIPDEDCYCVNGTCTLNDQYIISAFKVPIEQNQPYTITCYPVSGSVTAADGLFKTLYIECGDTETEYTALETIDVGTVKKSKTETNTKSFYTRTRYFINEGVVFNNLKFRIQFEKSSTSTDYEPYVGGMPSPSPYYPQEVKYNDLTYKLTGKNIFDLSDALPTTNWAGMENRPGYRYYDILTGLKNTYVTVSCNHQEQGKNVYIILKGESETWLYHSNNISLTKDKVTLRTDKNGTFKIIVCGDDSNLTEIFSDNFMVEIGSDATPYKPYYNGGSVTAPSLYRIGDVQDEWNAMTGHGVRNVCKIVLTGTENYTYAHEEYNQDEACDRYIPISDIKYGANAALSNQLTFVKKPIWNTAGYKNTFTIYERLLHIKISNDLLGVDINSDSGQEITNKFKSYISSKYNSNNPIVIYCELDNEESFESEALTNIITMPDGYAQFLSSGDGAAGDIEAEYAVDIEKRYVPKETYTALEERVAALESAAIGG